MLIESILISIVIQLLTTGIDIYGLKLNVNDNFYILKELLSVELGVQIVELIFYIWLIYSINSLKNITIYRYVDWFITTPVMLITLMAFLKIKETETQSLSNFLSENRKDVVYVILLNAVMLLFGLISEYIPSQRILCVLLGFIPFIMYYYHIYKEYLDTNKNNPEIHPVFTRERLFWYFFLIWSLYGVAAFLPYVLKNISFNILDLFSKNAFGIMLVYIISHHAI